MDDVAHRQVFNLSKDPRFRLFLTTEPHNKFPPTLLEVSLKVGEGAVGHGTWDGEVGG